VCFKKCLKKLVFHQSTVTVTKYSKSLYFIKVQSLAVRVALAPSRVYSILPPCIHPGLLSCTCVFFCLYCDAC